MAHNTDDQCQTVQVGSNLDQAKQPERLGPYLIQDLLGKGAMGEVFVAFHEKLRRKVALKVLPPFFNGSPIRVERFKREMAAIGRLDHPNVVRATDAGEDAGCQYIAMEYVNGLDLQQLIQDGGTLDVPTACEVIRQAAMGLQHVRDNDLVHRDIKPSNLMVTEQGVVKLLDLGIARLRNDDELGTLTAEGGLMGTPDFIAPEQVTDSGCVDIRADIYSLGCTLYRLLAGNAPFAGPEYGTNMAKVIAHTQHTPKCISKIIPGLPSELVKTIQKMMARDPKNRFQEPSEIVDTMCKWADAASLPNLITRHAGEGISLTAETKPAGLRVVSKNLFLKRLPKAAVVGIPVALGLFALLFAARRASTASPAPTRAPLTKVSSTEITTISPAERRFDSPLEPSTLLPSTLSPGNPIEQIAHHSGVTANATSRISSAVRSIDQNTSEIGKTLKTLETSLQNLANDSSTAEDQLIAHPKSDGELFHNAKTLSRLGRSTEARQSYLKLIQSRSPYVDVHQSFQDFAIAQTGLAGTRSIYAKHLTSTDPTIDLAVAMLHEPTAKRARLLQLVAAQPDFAPAIYELSKLLQEQPDQTLAEQEQELKLLNEVLSLHGEGQFLMHYLDKSSAGTVLTEITKRIRTLESARSKQEQPVRAAFLRQRRTWTANLQISEPCKEIWYSLNGRDYTTTGEGRFFDQRIGQIAPRSLFVFPTTNPPSAIFVKYTDSNGNSQGPFEIPFDAEAQTTSELKKRLKISKYYWATFGDGSNADKIYFTSLLAYRSLIKEVRFGLNVDQPNKVHELPDSTEDAGRLYRSVPDNVNYVVVQLKLTDGTESEVVRIDREPDNKL